MIQFYYQNNAFELKSSVKTKKWIENCIFAESFELGDINYIFCDDDYLLNLNIEFLKHDTFTDIINFDNTIGKLISGDVFISIDRVRENSNIFNVSFENELHRVMIHGILHSMGFKDKSKKEKLNMRNKENECLRLLTF